MDDFENSPASERKIPSKLKRILTMGVPVLVGFGILLFLGMIAYVNRRHADSGRTYADATLPVLLRSWDPKELFDRTDPDLLRLVVDQETVRGRLLALSDRFGGFRKCEGADGRLTVFLEGWRPRIRGRYSAHVLFDRGECIIEIEIVRRGAEWKTSRFGTDSETIIP